MSIQQTILKAQAFVPQFMPSDPAVCRKDEHLRVVCTPCQQEHCGAALSILAAGAAFAANHSSAQRWRSADTQPHVQSKAAALIKSRQHWAESGQNEPRCPMQRVDTTQSQRIGYLAAGRTSHRQSTRAAAHSAASTHRCWQLDCTCAKAIIRLLTYIIRTDAGGSGRYVLLGVSIYS